MLLAFTIAALLATTLPPRAPSAAPCCDRSRSWAAAAGPSPRASSARRTGEGPREVAEVGEDVDTMRRHLLDELDASRRASEALVLGQPAVQALQAALSRLCRRSRPRRRGADRVRRGRARRRLPRHRRPRCGRTAVVLGDVSGHGHEAAVVGLRIKSALSAMLLHAEVPDALAAVRDSLAGDPELFATIFIGVVDRAGGRLAYVNAGHPPPFVVGADGVPTWCRPDRS